MHSVSCYYSLIHSHLNDRNNTSNNNIDVTLLIAKKFNPKISGLYNTAANIKTVDKENTNFLNQLKKHQMNYIPFYKTYNSY